jgi:hypothetical protein
VESRQTYCQPDGLRPQLQDPGALASTACQAHLLQTKLRCAAGPEQHNQSPHSRHTKPSTYCQTKRHKEPSLGPLGSPFSQTSAEGRGFDLPLKRSCRIITTCTIKISTEYCLQPPRQHARHWTRKSTGTFCDCAALTGFKKMGHVRGTETQAGKATTTHNRPAEVCCYVQQTTRINATA